MKPEERARKTIDTLLEQAGWLVQDFDRMNLGSSQGVAVREFSLPSGTADYLLFIDYQPVGTIEAKKAGQTLIGVEEQSAKYLTNLPEILSTERPMLPFSYETTGIETRFTNHLDPEPRSRHIFAFHQPKTLAEWLEQAPVGVPNEQNDTLRARLRRLPPLPRANLRECQVEAITNLEHSFAENRPRALIQMATGSGKTFTAVSSIYHNRRASAPGFSYGGEARLPYLGLGLGTPLQSAPFTTTWQRAMIPVFNCTLTIE